MKTPILGQTYVARSVNAADSRMVNLYPEAVPEGGLETGYLNRCPGLNVLASIGTGPIRGLWAFGVYGYVVSGVGLYQIDSSFNSTFIANVSGAGPVSMSDNGSQLFIACNPNGFVYNADTNAFVQLTLLDNNFPGAVTVVYLDGYFIFNEPNSQRVWSTALLDGTSIDPLDFASAEGFPDGVVSIIADHREAWFFGAKSIEVWYDAGLPDFPLARIQGAFLEIGCAAPYSVAKMDNSVFWLGSDARGNGIVYRANGYTPTRISTHAVEYAIQQYSTLSDAVAYTYQQDGHTFYVLSFPSGNATWVFDGATNKWHERESFDNGMATRHRSNCQMNFAGQTVVGDYVNGNIYSMNLSTYSDNSGIQKWIRSWRALAPGTNNLTRTAQHELQLECQSGVGLVTGQGSDPQVLLRWSDDGGNTWSNYHSKSMGAIGETGHRVIWRRLGTTEKLRDRVYELSGTDPVKIAIMGADLRASRTSS